MWESSESAERRGRRKKLREMSQWLKDSGVEVGDCLFVPYKEYRSGPQVGELFYHYLCGLIFKEMGYLVANEYVLSEYGGERPDLCAFKTMEIERVLAELRKRGVIWAGAFMEELQLFNFFGKQILQAEVDGFLRASHRR